MSQLYIPHNLTLKESSVNINQYTLQTNHRSFIFDNLKKNISGCRMYSRYLGTRIFTVECEI